MAYWQVPRDWAGQTAFLLCGGPSALGQPLERLKGRNVVAVNRAWERVPFVQYLLWNDLKFWENFQAEIRKGFVGQVVQTLPELEVKGCLHLKRKKPPGLGAAPDMVVARTTVTSTGLNLLCHLGVARIVVLGLDLTADAAGRTHHYAPRYWPATGRTGAYYDGCKPERWPVQYEELKGLAADIAGLGVEVVNCSPESLADFWPRGRIEDYLR